MAVDLCVRPPRFQQSLRLPYLSRRPSLASSRLLCIPRPRYHRPSLALVDRFKRAGVVVRAAEKAKPGSVEDKERDSKILQYCSLNEKGSRRTLGDLEGEFLEALQSFYYDGKPIMSNEEFDNLKEELMWEGSRVVMLNPEEHKFMEASLSYQAGKKILSDEEYDKLKLTLRKQGSTVAMQGPRCSIRSRKVISDSSVDYWKMTLLNLPAVLIALGLVFFLDDVTGFEITYLLELPEPYSFLFTWFVVLPVTYLIARSLTNIVLKDALILKGPCPDCGAKTTSFFGSILSVESGGAVNKVSCEKCGSKLLYDLNTRLIEIDFSPDPPKGKKDAPKKTVAKSAS